MKKGTSILCILALIFLLAAAPTIQNSLPRDTKELISEKYSGWTGVLRIWVYEGWTPGAGSLSSWLNRCISSFEKSHEGVYIQPTWADASALASLGENGIRMPDMIIFPPGLLETPAHLLPVDTEGLRAPLQRCGGWMGINYAAPIAMGGYAWAYRSDALPVTLENEAIAAPMDDEHHRWSAALTALCAGHYSPDSQSEQGLFLSGIDLGLSLPESEPTPSPAPAGPLLPCRLPEEFKQSEGAYSQFTSEKATIMPVTQHELRRLEALSSQGKAGEWQAGISGLPFTDQIAMAAITEGAEDRGCRAECGAFIEHLLSEECQTQLYRAGAFSVTDSFSGYPAHDILNIIEDFLRREELMVAPAFGKNWISGLKMVSEKFLSGSAEAWTLTEEMRRAIQNNL